MIPEPAKALLASDELAHVTTLGPRGNPHVTLAWVGVDGDEIVFATLHDQKKLRHIRRDPRVVISVHTDKKNEWGLNEYLVAYGKGRVIEGGAPELLQELAETYLGPGVKFPPMPDPPAGFVTLVSIERVGGIGPWVV